MNRLQEQTIHNLTENDFQVELAQLLKLYRNGKLFELNQSPLLNTSLFKQTLLIKTESQSIATSRDLTEAILIWGINKLRPSGHPNWHSPFWRHYNLLRSFYLENLPIAIIAENMDIAEQTFYEWRIAALNALGQLLYKENQHPAECEVRQQQFATVQYQHLSRDEQRSLNLIIVSDTPLPLHPLFDVEEIHVLTQLQEKRFVTLSAEEQSVVQSDDLRHHFQQLLSEEDRLIAHEQLLTKCKQAGLVQESIFHAFYSHHYPQVVQIVLDHEEILLDTVDGPTVHPIMMRMVDLGQQQAEATPDQWARFLMVATKTAAWVDALDLALQYSRQALAAPDMTIKIQAYYQRAKLLSRVNLDECLSHYDVCFDLIQRSTNTQQETPPELKQLITKMYIDRAWLFIQERPDYHQANNDLIQAEHFIPIENDALWSDIYNARAGLISRQESAKEAIPFRLKAYTAAEASGDIERMTKMAYNLGSGYLFTGDYENGRFYLDKSREWAIRSGNLQTLGLVHKGLGTCHFFTEAYDEAITHYEQAYDIWCQTHNKNWQTYISYDLVEAYATIGRFGQAQQQLFIGKQLATELGNERILAELNELSKQFPALNVSLSERQMEALAFVHKHGSINRQRYIELSGVAKSQAYRDLEELCQSGLLQRVGKGRGTRYVQG